MSIDETNAIVFTNDNCSGCNRCIAACTVPEANIARMEDGKNKIYIDPKHCINCGKCMSVCPHNARDYADDTEEFLNDLLSGEKIALIVAPSIRTNIKRWKNLLGLLRKSGASPIYDTSFGADITTWAYIKYIKENQATGMISQPCPAVVNYIEKHDPPLLKALMPVHSPVLCGAIFMRKYAGISGKIAFISPCIAKKDEFSDPNTKNAIQYNVTFQKLLSALEARNINYSSSPETDFDSDPHGLGAIYPSPGGLKQNVISVIPDAWVYQVEGQPEVKDFLNEYPPVFEDEFRKPLLVDILNCGKGCNLGTGATCRGIDALDVDRRIQVITDDIKAPHKRHSSKKNSLNLLIKKTHEKFNNELKLKDFIRNYTNKYVTPTVISPSQKENAFISLHKFTKEERTVDCGACGYHTCDEMSDAIARDINHHANCVEYHRSILSQRKKEVEELMKRQQAKATQLRENVATIFEKLNENETKRQDTISMVDSIGNDMAGLKEISERLKNMMDQLNEKLQDYLRMGSQIVEISTMTSLLSMNAAVEAAHAGQQGKGFVVVADEMKILSDQSGKSARDIVSSNEKVFPILEEIRGISDNLNAQAFDIAASTSKILQSMEEINVAEQQITIAANTLLDNEKQPT